VKYASVPWPPLEAALPIFNVSFFLLKNNFWEIVNKSKGNCHQCRNISFIKTYILKRSVGYFSTSWCHKQTLRY
jgi:hypothetical protein